MKHAGEVKSNLSMKILDWCIYTSYCVGAQLRILVSSLGWCLHNILLSWSSTEEIGVSSRLVPTQYLVELVFS
jgi:hypothetical protein